MSLVVLISRAHFCLAPIISVDETITAFHSARVYPFQTPLIKMTESEYSGLWIDSYNQALGFGPADFVRSGGVMFMHEVSHGVAHFEQCHSNSECVHCSLHRCGQSLDLNVELDKGNEWGRCGPHEPISISCCCFVSLMLRNGAQRNRPSHGQSVMRNPDEFYEKLLRLTTS